MTAARTADKKGERSVASSVDWMVVSTAADWAVWKAVMTAVPTVGHWVALSVVQKAA